MTMQRAHALKFKGTYDAAGRPDRYFPFAPARDLEARDIANLSDDEYAELLGGSKPLYAEVKRPEPKAETTKPAVPATPKTAAKSPDAPGDK